MQNDCLALQSRNKLCRWFLGEQQRAAGSLSAVKNYVLHLLDVNLLLSQPTEYSGKNSHTIVVPDDEMAGRLRLVTKIDCDRWTTRF